MRNALKSLMKFRIIYILIIFQLSVGLSMINISTTVQSNAQNKINKFNKLFNFESTYLSQLVTFHNINPDELSTDRMKSLITTKGEEVYKKIVELESEGVIKDIYIYEPISGFINGVVENIAEQYKNLPDDTLRKYASCITMNQEFYERYNIPIVEGRGLQRDDFNRDYKTETIPIVIGEDYRGKVSLGEKFTQEYNFMYIGQEANVTYEVVGFYKSGNLASIWSSNKFIDSLTYSDSLQIRPIIHGTPINELWTMIDYGFFLDITSGSNKQKVESEISKILEGTNFYLKLIPLNEDYENAVNVLREDWINSLVLGGMMVFLSILGTIVTMIGEVNKRNREFGVKIGCGATKKKLIKEMFLEIFLLVSMSVIIAYSITFIKSLFIEGTVLWMNIVIINFILTIVLTCIISIIPIIKLSKLSVIEMIKER